MRLDPGVTCQLCGQTEDGKAKFHPPKARCCVVCENPIPGSEKWADGSPVSDPVNHPSHYTAHPSGVECIQITEHYGFCIGNAIKYLWRAGLKGDAVEDLEKAAWYVNREIERRRKASA